MALPPVEAISVLDRFDDAGGAVKLCFRSFFGAMSRIMRLRLLDGAVLNREIAWHFIRGGAFRPYVKPNAHAYVNMDRRLTIEDGMKLLHHLTDAYRRLKPAYGLYPVVHIADLPTPKDLVGWLYYIVKPHKFVAAY